MLRQQAKEFRDAFGFESRQTPGLPSEENQRLSAKLIAEEACETLAAFFTGDAEAREAIAYMSGWLQRICKHSPLCVDIVSLADGFANLDYVVEGARLGFGIDGAPIADLVHASNMAKLGGEIRPDVKRLKPPGWVGPNIYGELARQGLGTDGDN